jgi:hypothetical protein
MIHENFSWFTNRQWYKLTVDRYRNIILRLKMLFRMQRNMWEPWLRFVQCGRFWAYWLIRGSTLYI